MERHCSQCPFSFGFQSKSVTEDGAPPKSIGRNQRSGVLLRRISDRCAKSGLSFKRDLIKMKQDRNSSKDKLDIDYLKQKLDDGKY